MPFLDGTNGISKVISKWLFGPIRISALRLLDQSETAHQVLFFSQQANSHNLSGKPKLIFYLLVMTLLTFERWVKGQGGNTTLFFVVIYQNFMMIP